jgi:hypothetical protein
MQTMLVLGEIIVRMPLSLKHDVDTCGLAITSSTSSIITTDDVELRSTSSMSIQKQTHDRCDSKVLLTDLSLDASGKLRAHLGQMTGSILMRGTLSPASRCGHLSEATKIKHARPNLLFLICKL